METSIEDSGLAYVDELYEADLQLINSLVSNINEISKQQLIAVAETD